METIDLYTDVDGVLVTEASTLQHADVFTHPVTDQKILCQHITEEIANGEVVGWRVNIPEAEELLIVND